MTSRLRAYIILARPKHWIKNIFVLAPVVFAGRITDPRELVLAIVAFFAMCFASSTIYVLNDLYDAECDKQHPRKRKRPIPSGAVGRVEAVALLLLLLVVVAWLTQYITVRQGYIFGAVVLGYLLLNLFYSAVGKHVEIVDAFCIAIGFVLRVVGGAYAIGVEPTGWIVVTTFFLSLFLGFGKRRNEIILLNESHGNHRNVLTKYHLPVLDQIIVSTGTIAIISYSLYTLDQDVVRKFGTGKLFYTIPFVAYGIFRYIQLLMKSKEGDPTEVLTSDRHIMIDVVLWLLAAYAIVYFDGGHFR